MLRAIEVLSRIRFLAIELPARGKLLAEGADAFQRPLAAPIPVDCGSALAHHLDVDLIAPSAQPLNEGCGKADGKPLAPPEYLHLTLLKAICIGGQFERSRRIRPSCQGSGDTLRSSPVCPHCPPSGSSQIVRFIACSCFSA
jgi:hypothetical protein